MEPGCNCSCFWTTRRLACDHHNTVLQTWTSGCWMFEKMGGLRCRQKRFFFFFFFEPGAIKTLKTTEKRAICVLRPCHKWWKERKKRRRAILIDLIFGTTAVCVRRHDPSQCICACIVCVVLLVFVLVLSGKSKAPRGRTVCAKLCCSTPLRWTGWTNLPSPFQSGGCQGWWWDFFVVYLGKESRRELCESTETVCNLFGEPVPME